MLSLFRPLSRSHSPGAVQFIIIRGHGHGRAGPGRWTGVWNWRKTVSVAKKVRSAMGLSLVICWATSKNAFGPSLLGPCGPTQSRIQMVIYLHKFFKWDLRQGLSIRPGRRSSEARKMPPNYNNAHNEMKFCFGQAKPHGLTGTASRSSDVFACGPVWKWKWKPKWKWQCRALNSTKVWLKPNENAQVFHAAFGDVCRITWLARHFLRRPCQSCYCGLSPVARCGMPRWLMTKCRLDAWDQASWLAFNMAVNFGLSFIGDSDASSISDSRVAAIRAKKSRDEPQISPQICTAKFPKRCKSILEVPP